MSYPRWVRKIGIYGEFLEKLNEEFRTIKKSDCIDDLFVIIENVEKFASTLFILIPCQIDNERIKLKNEAILRFTPYFPFLKEDFEKMVKNNEEVLVRIKKIRNKIEHDPHMINARSVSSGTAGSEITYQYGFDDEEATEEEKAKIEYFTINDKELKNIVQALNKIFDKIFSGFNKYIEDKDKDHPYVIKWANKKFSDYNDKI